MNISELSRVSLKLKDSEKYVHGFKFLASPEEGGKTPAEGSLLLADMNGVFYGTSLKVKGVLSKLNFVDGTKETAAMGGRRKSMPYPATARFLAISENGEAALSCVDTGTSHMNIWVFNMESKKMRRVSMPFSEKIAFAAVSNEGTMFLTLLMEKEPKLVVSYFRKAKEADSGWSFKVLKNVFSDCNVKSPELFFASIDEYHGEGTILLANLDKSSYRKMGAEFVAIRVGVDTPPIILKRVKTTLDVQHIPTSVILRWSKMEGSGKDVSERLIFMCVNYHTETSTVFYLCPFHQLGVTAVQYDILFKTDIKSAKWSNNNEAVVLSLGDSGIALLPKLSPPLFFYMFRRSSPGRLSKVDSLSELQDLGEGNSVHVEWNAADDSILGIYKENEIISYSIEYLNITDLIQIITEKMKRYEPPEKFVIKRSIQVIILVLLNSPVELSAELRATLSSCLHLEFQSRLNGCTSGQLYGFFKQEVLPLFTWTQRQSIALLCAKQVANAFYNEIYTRMSKGMRSKDLISSIDTMKKVLLGTEDLIRKIVGLRKNVEYSKMSVIPMYMMEHWTNFYGLLAQLKMDSATMSGGSEEMLHAVNKLMGSLKKKVDAFPEPILIADISPGHSLFAKGALRSAAEEYLTSKEYPSLMCTLLAMKEIEDALQLGLWMLTREDQRGAKHCYEILGRFICSFFIELEEAEDEEHVCVDIPHPLGYSNREKIPKSALRPITVRIPTRETEELPSALWRPKTCIFFLWKSKVLESREKKAELELVLRLNCVSVLDVLWQNPSAFVKAFKVLVRKAMDPECGSWHNQNPVEVPEGTPQLVDFVSQSFSDKMSRASASKRQQELIDGLVLRLSSFSRNTDEMQICQLLISVIKVFRQNLLFFTYSTDIFPQVIRMLRVINRLMVAALNQKKMMFPSVFYEYVSYLAKFKQVAAIPKISVLEAELKSSRKPGIGFLTIFRYYMRYVWCSFAGFRLLGAKKKFIEDDLAKKQGDVKTLSFTCAYWALVLLEFSEELGELDSGRLRKEILEMARKCRKKDAEYILNRLMTIGCSDSKPLCDEIAQQFEITLKNPKSKTSRAILVYDGINTNNFLSDEFGKDLHWEYELDPRFRKHVNLQIEVLMGEYHELLEKYKLKREAYVTEYERNLLKYLKSSEQAFDINNDQLTLRAFDMNSSARKAILEGIEDVELSDDSDEDIVQSKAIERTKKNWKRLSTHNLPALFVDDFVDE